MDWTNWQDILLLVAVVALFVVSIVYRQRKNSKAPMLIAFGLFRDVDRNLKLLDNFSRLKKAKLFKTSSWRKNQTKMDFLNEELRSAINSGFKMADELNVQIESAKKSGSVAYLATIPVEKLREPLTKSKDGLGKWIQEHWGDRSLMPKRVGFFN